ncbi:MAG TPA: hypothetical protein VM487_02855, partial [Phycisphaerae bacterium]|nr:hypothetical protein [Phycisphaerae bacterium]
SWCIAERLRPVPDWGAVAALVVAAAHAAKLGLIKPVWSWLDEPPRWPHSNPEAVYLGRGDNEEDIDLWLLPSGTAVWSSDCFPAGVADYLVPKSRAEALARAREAELLPPEAKPYPGRERALTAIDASIAHWEKNTTKLETGKRLGDHDWRDRKCPLCQAYARECHLCPLFFYGKSCSNGAWGVFRDAVHAHGILSLDAIRAAQGIIDELQRVRAIVADGTSTK